MFILLNNDRVTTMSITSIVDFAQVLTEAERYRPAAEKILKGEPDQAV